MIVRSESFLGYEEHASRDLLTVIIEPEADPARTSEGAAAKRRCVTVQVNGSGQLSRWYFQADGTLENIDLADGLRRVRTESPRAARLVRERRPNAASALSRVLFRWRDGR